MKLPEEGEEVWLEDQAGNRYTGTVEGSVRSNGGYTVALEGSDRSFSFKEDPWQDSRLLGWGYRGEQDYRHAAESLRLNDDFDSREVLEGESTLPLAD